MQNTLNYKLENQNDYAQKRQSMSDFAENVNFMASFYHVPIFSQYCPFLSEYIWGRYLIFIVSRLSKLLTFRPNLAQSSLNFPKFTNNYEVYEQTLIMSDLDITMLRFTRFYRCLA